MIELELLSNPAILRSWTLLAYSPVTTAFRLLYVALTVNVYQELLELWKGVDITAVDVLFHKLKN